MIKIGSKIIGSVVITFMVIALTVAVILYFLEVQRRDTSLNRINHLLQSVLESQKESIANEIYAGHGQALELSLNRFLDIDNVVSVTVYDPDGVPIASVGTLDKRALSLAEKSSIGARAIFSRTMFNGEEVAEYGSTITAIGNTIGFAKIRYSLAELNRQTRYIYYIMGGSLAVLFLLMISLLRVALNRLVVAPVRTLGAAMNQVRGGSLGHRVEIDNEDEVGEMAAAFNLMSEQLFQNRQEILAAIEEKNRYADELQDINRKLESFNQELETQVRKRTQELYEANLMLTAEVKERKQAEEKYRSIFDNAQEGIFQAGLSGRFVDANPAAAEILGYDSPQELMGAIADMHSQLFVNPEESRLYLSQIQGAGEVNRFVTRFYKKDKETIWVDLSARTVRDETGQFTRIEGLLADITAQKSTEKERKKLEDQLRQSQKLEALGNLAGGIAHDFNNLLQALSGHIQLMLLRMPADDKYQKYLKEMDRTVDNATNLVQQLLTFSRKMDVDYQTVSINDIVMSATNLLERTIPKMVSIDCRLDPELALIQADPTQMEQVIMNLANNAVDAMQGAGTLTIETQNFPLHTVYKNAHLELPSGDYVLIKVTDTGIGMDESTRAHIFEPFFTTKEMGKGTGLGLATVFGTISNHKGRIACYSELGKGTTFKIFLPVTVAEQRPTAVAPAPEGVQGGDETVLLVDDDEVISEIAEELLAELGYSVRRAASGEEALSIYGAYGDAIDLVIMDLGMPGMGGEKCLQELNRLDSDVKVIMASGYAAHRIARKPGEFGAKGFLVKPYRLDYMAAMVRKVLDLA